MSLVREREPVLCRPLVCLNVSECVFPGTWKELGKIEKKWVRYNAERYLRFSRTCFVSAADRVDHSPESRLCAASRRDPGVSGVGGQWSAHPQLQTVPRAPDRPRGRTWGGGSRGGGSGGFRGTPSPLSVLSLLGPSQRRGRDGTDSEPFIRSFVRSFMPPGSGRTTGAGNQRHSRSRCVE